MLIDVHVHLLPPRRLAGLMTWMHRAFPAHPVPVEVTLDACVADYAALGADYLFNLAYPIREEETDGLIAFNADLHARHPWIIPWGSLHPDSPDKPALVARCVEELGFLGFKFHPFIQRFWPTDARMLPAYQALERARRPVVFHTGFEEFYGRALPPDAMEEVVRAFPRLPVVFAHSLFPEFASAFRMLERYDTVYLEMTNVFGALDDARYRTMGVGDRHGLVEGLRAHSDRIMFGSDHPAGMGTLAEVYRGLDAQGLPERVKENLLGETARRFVERFMPGFLATSPPLRRC